LVEGLEEMNGSANDLHEMMPGMDNPGVNGNGPNFFVGRMRAFGCAFRGFGVLVATQHAAWVHAAAMLTACVLGWWVGLKREEWLWVVAAIALMWLAEALNTALEFLCDAVHPGQHPLIRNAKDIGATAVLITAVAAIIIGVLIFGPHLFGVGR
jgi:diacylglycerol kinase (ATP)